MESQATEFFVKIANQIPFEKLGEITRINLYEAVVKSIDKGPLRKCVEANLERFYEVFDKSLSDRKSDTTETIKSKQILKSFCSLELDYRKVALYLHPLLEEHILSAKVDEKVSFDQLQCIMLGNSSIFVEIASLLMHGLDNQSLSCDENQVAYMLDLVSSRLECHHQYLVDQPIESIFVVCALLTLMILLDESEDTKFDPHRYFSLCCTNFQSLSYILGFLGLVGLKFKGVRSSKILPKLESIFHSLMKVCRVEKIKSHIHRREFLLGGTLCLFWISKIPNSESTLQGCYNLMKLFVNNSRSLALCLNEFYQSVRNNTIPIKEECKSMTDILALVEQHQLVSMLITHFGDMIVDHSAVDGMELEYDDNEADKEEDNNSSENEDNHNDHWESIGFSIDTTRDNYGEPMGMETIAISPLPMELFSEGNGIETSNVVTMTQELSQLEKREVKEDEKAVSHETTPKKSKKVKKVEAVEAIDMDVVVPSEKEDSSSNIQRLTRSSVKKRSGALVDDLKDDESAHATPKSNKKTKKAK